MADYTKEVFKTHELLEIVNNVGVPLEADVLHDWHRRRIFNRPGLGRGKERQYSFDELVGIFAFAFLATRIHYFNESRGILVLLTASINKAYRATPTGPDGLVSAAEPIYLIKSQVEPRCDYLEEVEGGLTLRRLAGGAGVSGSAAVIVAPGFLAIDLYGAIEQTIERRG
jgi:hypothetical protein